MRLKILTILLGITATASETDPSVTLSYSQQVALRKLIRDREDAVAGITMVIQEACAPLHIPSDHAAECGVTEDLQHAVWHKSKPEHP